MFIARELRQPVATVRNYVQGLRRTLDLRGALKADVAEKSLLRLDEQAERIERIVERVHANGRVEGPQRRPVDAVVLSKSAVETLRATRPENFPVTIRSCKPNCTILAWELCVQNLVKNALEAVLENGAPVPQPSALEALQKIHPEWADWIWSAVERPFRYLCSLTERSKVPRWMMFVSIAYC